MSEKKIKWTSQQLRAIKEHGRDVLVTASAGTGKTAVLSGRCVDIVSNKTSCPDILSVLVLTFTDMAAEQMRSRIAEQLEEAFAQKPDTHLRHQLLLLQAADISTIHAFCKRLITEHFYKLGLDPTFRIIDSDEQMLLKTEALDKTIEWAWQQENLKQALQQLLYRRDLRTNDGFISILIRLSNFLDGIISQDKWFSETAILSKSVNPSDTSLGKKQKEIILAKLKACRLQLKFAQQLEQKLCSSTNWAETLEEDYIEPIDKCIVHIEGNDFSGCISTIDNFKRTQLRQYDLMTDETARIIKKPIEQAVKTFRQLKELAILNPDYLNKIGLHTEQQVKVILELLRKFDELYKQSKRKINCLDFADLEHYALKLLTDENFPNDHSHPSETAILLRRKYKYIFVDEYQDINQVQQAILSLLSAESNLFVVGDIKQSIYAFRGAEPEIFLQNLKAASTEPTDNTGGVRIDLNVNFRSVSGIIDFVNMIFSRIMTESFAKIDYDESAMLKPAVIDKAESNCAVELHIIDEQGRKSEHDENSYNQTANSNIVTSRQCQAVMIAKRINQIVGTDTAKPEFQIYDKSSGMLRPAEYRDIVILMRSLAKKANDYVEILQLAGIPVSCQATAGYFETTEITDMLCLLKVLDNPQRDIEFAAVLRSPFFKITDTEFAKVKIHSKNETDKTANNNFYNHIASYLDSGSDKELADKLRASIKQIDTWRQNAQKSDLADLIWQIYRQTHYLSFVTALPNGRARKANLLKLHDRAIQFEGFASSRANVSLTRFVEFIEQLQQAGQDWAPAEPETAAGNAVRILSVHKSKGLEFPIVFLAELESPFNKNDFQDDLLTDAEDTLGLRIIDRDAKVKFSSLAHQVIAEKKQSKSLAEEMRILYVAMTRAKERLILTASEKQDKCKALLSNGHFLTETPIPDWQLRSCDSQLAWILYGLSNQKALHTAFKTSMDDNTEQDNLFSIKRYEQQGLGDLFAKLKTGKTKPPNSAPKQSSQNKSSTPLSDIKKALAWQYEYSDTTHLPTKQSVTQLTHNTDEFAKADYSAVLKRVPQAISAPEVDLSQAVNPQLLGTAKHAVIAMLDLANPVTTESIQNTINKLIAENAITNAVTEQISIESILSFFETEPGKAALDKNNTVRREYPFTFALPASQFPNTSGEPQATSDEIVVVQGIIDMLIQTPAGLLIIDFKNDSVSAGRIAERAELYRRQLELYSQAAEKILNRKTLAKWLYFLKPQKALKI